MDIALARTFLEIVETGSFAAAAAKLNVTQSAVSMRIKALEAELGRPLFQRGRGGLALTRAGQHFQRHAADLVRLWAHARQEVALPDDVSARLVVGAEVSLWQGPLLAWMARMQAEAPDVALRTEIGGAEALLRLLGEGLLDLAAVYAPQSRPGLVVEELLVEELVLVATDPAIAGPGDPRYTFVDWGPAFRTAHARAFPDSEMPRLALGIGVLGLAHLKAAGGAGYFPRRAVAADLAAGALHAVAEAPAFAVPAYLVYAKASLAQPWFAAARTRLFEVVGGLSSRP